MAYSPVNFVPAGFVRDGIPPSPSSSDPTRIDLHAAIRLPYDINPGVTVCLSTGYAPRLAAPTSLLILPRNELAIKHRIQLANGVDYRSYLDQSELFIVLFNAGRNQYTIRPGEVIAQAILLKVQLL